MKFFVNGPVTNEIISNMHSGLFDEMNSGAAATFIGKVREDKTGNASVCGIIYSAYLNMAEIEIQKLADEITEKYQLTKVIIQHSLGTVKAGEMSLFAAVTSTHRKEAFGAIEEIVERLKTEVPIWKKEIWSDNSHKWV